MINDITHEFNGRLDIFVANAGIPWTQGGMIDGQLSHYHKVVSTDLDSVFYCAKAAGEIFRRQYTTGVNMYGDKLKNYSYGSFIATSSMSGHIANIPQLQAAVSAPQATLVLFTHYDCSTTQQKQACDIFASHWLSNGSNSRELTASHLVIWPPKYRTLCLRKRKRFGTARFRWDERVKHMN